MHRLAAMVRAADGTRLRVAPRERLVAQDGSVDGVWLIEAGLFALRRLRAGGHRVVTLLRPGDLYGDIALVTGVPSAFEMVSVSAAEVFRMPADGFADLRRRSPEFACLWGEHVARRLGSYQGRVLELLAGDVRAQVAALLLREFELADSTELSQQMIADLLGVQRGTVNRVVRNLEERGAVRTGYAQLVLRDRRTLAAAAGRG